MSGYIGTQPVPQATQTRDVFTATSGQTTFATSGYTPNFLDVWLNGVKLVNGDDFTATNGSDVVLTSGATAGDTVEVLSYSTFEVADRNFTGDTSAENFTVTGTFTSRGIDDNATSTAVTLDASGNVLVGTTDSNPVANNINSGVQIGDGRIRASRADRAVIEMNRKTSDGSIAEFRKDGTTVGSIGVQSSADLTIGSGTSGFSFSSAGNAVVPNNPATNTYRDAAINLGYSGGRFKDLYLSGGVYLGGTGAANLLDDYEQGTFNVELWAGTTQLALSEYGGSYVKIGNLVTVNFEADCSNTNGAVGALQLRGMPFTIADVLSPTGVEANGSVSYWQNWSTSINSPTLYAEGGTTILYVMGCTSSTAASNTNLTAANIGTGEFRGTITYRTT